MTDWLRRLAGRTHRVGFAGMERLLLVLENTGYQIQCLCAMIYIASMGQEAETRAFLLASNLRKLGVKVEEIDHIGRSVKAQLKYADKVGARYVLVLGGDEREKKAKRNSSA